MRVLIILLLLSMVSELTGQSFSEKTNAIKLDFSDKKIATSYPNIYWISPQYEISTSPKKKVSIQVRVSSETYLEKISIELKLPDNTTFDKEHDINENTTFKTITQSLNLMSDGQYDITVRAKNKSGGEVSDTRQLIVGMDAISSAVSLDRKDKAILFATDKYDYWGDLVNPIFDAETIAQILKNRYGFEVDFIQNPTQEEVYIKLADYSQNKYNPQDQLLIFFAGHGYFDETFGEGYVVAKNSLENDRAKTSYISHNRLRSVINNIPCEHILLTMDVCFGGTFDPSIASEKRGLAKTSIDNDEEFLARKLSYKTRKYLTSGGKTYVSDGIIGKHSPFARQLIKALKSGGANDRILTINEIRPFIEKLIPEPRLGSFGDDQQASDFVFVQKIY